MELPKKVIVNSEDEKPTSLDNDNANSNELAESEVKNHDINNINQSDREMPLINEDRVNMDQHAVRSKSRVNIERYFFDSFYGFGFVNNFLLFLDLSQIEIGWR